MKVGVEKFLKELASSVNMDSGQGNPDGIFDALRFSGVSQ